MRLIFLPLLAAINLGVSAAHAVCATNFAGDALPTSQFTVNPDETVNDGVTGLMWKRCLEGLSGAGCSSGSHMPLGWNAALLAAKSSNFAGYSDWRLPSKAELESLVDDTCFDPPTPSGVFPNTSQWLVTSTTAYGYDGNFYGGSAWLVSFASGDSAPDNKIGGFVGTYVRLVRGGQFDALTLPCNLDINADGAVNAAKDGVLLLRYLLGFRGAALIDGVAIGPARGGAAGVESFIGSAAKYDVFGRPAPVVTALSDGLVLARLMNGVPDTALLNNVPLPAGATNLLAATVRSSVNARCGTSF